jgi:tetratricopeptide (TPR) repeat protein
MARKKKITRKQLLKEPDEFMTLTGKLIQFAGTHKTQITYAVIAIVALALTVSAYRFFSIRAENNAMAMLNQAVAKYQLSVKDSDFKEAYSAVSGDFQQILKKYGSKKGGKLARVSYANICFDAGQYEQAIELYKAALNDFADHPFVYHLILSGIGYAYEQLNDDQTAVSYFEKITVSDEPVMGGEALFNIGVIYEKFGEKEKSNQAFDQILSNYPDSIYINLVKERPGK